MTRDIPNGLIEISLQPSAGCITIPFCSWGYQGITRGHGLLEVTAGVCCPLASSPQHLLVPAHHSRTSQFCFGFTTGHVRRIGEPQWDTTFHSGGSDSKESAACSRGDPGSLPALGRSPREWHGYPLQYTSLKNPVDWGAWQATVNWVAKSRTGLGH